MLHTLLYMLHYAEKTDKMNTPPSKEDIAAPRRGSVQSHCACMHGHYILIDFIRDTAQ